MRKLAMKEGRRETSRGGRGDGDGTEDAEADAIEDFFDEVGARLGGLRDDVRGELGSGSHDGRRQRWVRARARER